MFFQKPLLLVTLLLSVSYIVAQSTFKNKKVFVYKVHFTDTVRGIDFYDLVTLSCKWGRVNGGQKKVVWKYYPSFCYDSLLLNDVDTIFGKCQGYCYNKSKQNITLINSVTGVIENKKQVWLHPPRAKYYKILELAPFPYVNFVDTVYSDKLVMGRGYGKMEGKQVVSNYKVSIPENQQYLITASAVSDEGTIRATFVYSKQKGFEKMTYHLFNNVTITFWLVN